MRIFWIALMALAAIAVGTVAVSARGCPAYDAVVAAQAAAPAATLAPTPGPAEYHKITPEEAKTRIDSGEAVVIVDVRTKAEYDAGHIPGAILVPNEEIGAEMPAPLPDAGAELLIYCRSGRRSAEAARKLVKLGYWKVYDFGGIIDWPYETVK